MPETRSTRSLTTGLVVTIMLVAFETLAIITIMPVVSEELDGVGLAATGSVTTALAFAAAAATAGLVGVNVARRLPTRLLADSRATSVGSTGAASPPAYRSPAPVPTPERGSDEGGGCA